MKGLSEHIGDKAFKKTEPKLLWGSYTNSNTLNCNLLELGLLIDQQDVCRSLSTALTKSHSCQELCCNNCSFCTSVREGTHGVYCSNPVLGVGYAWSTEEKANKGQEQTQLSYQLKQTTGAPIY